MFGFSEVVPRPGVRERSRPLPSNDADAPARQAPGCRRRGRATEATA
ncbi:hypothetical protein BN2537_3411 [Streptomyces venezuelae]|nr:hypothetical protein BN2537_3411 [Streptomyces venezuelae]